MCVCEADIVLGSADHAARVYLQCVLYVCVCATGPSSGWGVCVCTVCVCVQYRLHSTQQEAVAHCPSVNFISHGQYQIPTVSSQPNGDKHTYTPTHTSSLA